MNKVTVVDESCGQFRTELRDQIGGSCDIEIPHPCGLIVFGASGDLTKRKIIPALYHLHINRLLPENFFILGIGRTEISTDQFRDSMCAAVKNSFLKDFDDRLWKEFAVKLDYLSLDYSFLESYTKTLRETLSSLEKRHHTSGNRIFYLATPPTLLEKITLNLGLAGLSNEDTGYSHIVIEKPFGRDLDSAKRLNNILQKSFEERQIYRIDHYLAKETVQNIIMFRFANSIFEPIWNRRYIDHVQITASETIGIEHRAGYYEETGVIRDMFQSHIFQLIALTAMEAPTAFEADRVMDEKVKVFRSITALPMDKLNEYVVIGQYGRGKINGNSVSGYREEPGVSEKSTVPTFAAMKVFVDNWRWAGVPFYIRSGKRLSRRKTEISIHFKPVPHMMFSKTIDEPIRPNTLALRVQPDEGISLTFQVKRPGSKVCLRPVLMDFSYRGDVLLDAYEWVLLDCMHGDHMLFLREDGVELTWSLLTPVIDKLESTTKMGKFSNYIAGSTGPDEAALLIERDGRAWEPL